MPKKKSESTYDRIMRDRKRKERFAQRYAEFLLSEIVLGLMEQEKISIRELAREVGVSPSVIQDIRSGKRKNITVKNLVGIASALGAKVVIQKDEQAFPLGD